MFTATEYADWLRTQAALKRPYWFGTCGYECTESLRKRKAKQYPAHYGSARTAQYRRDIDAKQICGDCIGGAIKWAAWSDLGRKASEYASGGCPDTTADGLFRHCKLKGMEWGGMASLPDEAGIAVRSAGHVGVTVGGGKAVEWRGFRYGCVITDVKKRPWTHWYRLPWVEYGETAATEETLCGSRLLRMGAKGEDVRQLQQLLNETGFDAGEEDGIFCELTRAAVVRMQRAAEIDADGEYGEISHRALMDMLADLSPEEEQTQQAQKTLRVTGGRVNIRSGAGTQYRILAVVPKDTLLPYTAQADNGWFAVAVNGETGWISGRYAQPQ